MKIHPTPCNNIWISDVILRWCWRCESCGSDDRIQCRVALAW